jgi:hypothetical protein
VDEAVATHKVTVDNHASKNAPTSGRNVTVETNIGNGKKNLCLRQVTMMSNFCPLSNFMCFDTS